MKTKTIERKVEKLHVDEEDQYEDSDVSDHEDANSSAEDSDEDFEKQSSSDESVGSDDDNSDDDNFDESKTRSWSGVGIDRSKKLEEARQTGELGLAQYLDNDDLSSDDEDAEGNTIGRVPLHWYDAYDHIGYDVAGGKLLKRKGRDRIDITIANRDDPDARKTIYDMYNDREVVLTDRELEIIRRIQAGAFAHPEHDDTPDYIDYYSSQKEVMPISAAPEPKRRFVPSKWEMIRVMKIVKAIKEGRYKEGEKTSDKDKKPPVYLIWDDVEDDIIAESKKNQYHLPAPKMPLPGHAESYNPPPEYLLSDEELVQYNDMDPSERPYNFIPKAHQCLRHVAGYENFVKERFERCLDLYLCPRKLKRRLNIDPETLVPRLPKPKELKPFPNTLCLQYLGHTAAVRSISISPDGQYLASASEDGTVRLWEIDTSLCRYIWDLQSGPVTHISWNPNPEHHYIVAIAGHKVIFITTGTGDSDSTEITETQLSNLLEKAESKYEETANSSQSNKKNKETDDEEDDNDDDNSDDNENGNKNNNNNHSGNSIKYKLIKNNKNITENETKDGQIIGPRFEMYFTELVNHLAWHHKGDYLSVLCTNAGAKAVSIHQISKGNTQYPFAKSPGMIQCISFHPSRPFLFVVTQQHVKIYHLVEQKLMKKLLSGCKWLSSIDIHSTGDHIILGSYDRRVLWFDLDLASTPYKTLKYHERAVRNVQYHKRYPLMASASDDGSVHIFHSMVYNDLTRNPLIVPLKVLKGHGVIGGIGVFSIVFHPKQPWIFTCGADSVINLYQDI